MIVVRCPYCSELRHEGELEHGGEAETVRPPEPEQESDKAWVDYLFMCQNTKGVLLEQWCCRGGCQQWFKVARDTVSHEVKEIVPFDVAFTFGWTERS